MNDFLYVYDNQGQKPCSMLYAQFVYGNIMRCYAWVLLQVFAIYGYVVKYISNYIDTNIFQYYIPNILVCTLCMHVAPFQGCPLQRTSRWCLEGNALQLYDPSSVSAFAAKLKVCLEHSIPNSFTSEWNSHLRKLQVVS